LLQIDVNALAHYVERLQLALSGAQTDARPALVLDRLRDNIRIRVQRKINVLSRALICAESDRNKARDELKQIDPIKPTRMILSCSAFVDLEFDDAPFSAKLAFLDRLLALGEERSNQLQYRGGKASNINDRRPKRRRRARNSCKRSTSLEKQKEKTLQQFRTSPIRGGSPNACDDQAKMARCLRRAIDTLMRSCLTITDEHRTGRGPTRDRRLHKYAGAGKKPRRHIGRHWRSSITSLTGFMLPNAC